MPRIDDQFLDCSIYLYPTVAMAKAGERAGGTGFIVGVPYRRAKGFTHRYAVTYSHVVTSGAPVVRINTKDGEFDVLDLAPDQWIHHRDGHDIAVCPVSLPASDFKYKWLPQELFVTKELIEKEDIGPGDEAFFTGRFISHEGRQRNLPTVRFGNISMMPWEKVRNRMGVDQESFLVEARSLSGYSGSPVFVYISAFDKRPGKATTISGKHGGPWLLGIDWGHVNEHQKVLESDGKTHVKDGWLVTQNSGMMAVQPAWNLAELLQVKELEEMREDREKQSEAQVRPDA